MSPLRLLVLPVAAASLLATGCGSQGRQIAQRDLEIRELEAQVGDLQGQLSDRDRELAELRSKPAAVVVRDPAADARRDLEGTGADVTWRNGELVIGLTNDILFASGRATLTADAKTRLGRVADVIKRRYASNYVRVDGHTDNQPIVRTRNLWEDNWHLAGARARAVLHELVDRGGVPARRIGFAGFAEHRPVADNSNRSGQAKNRRVEIIVLPTERPGN